MEVRFCPGCSHVVPPHYLYCPQCGHPLGQSPDLEVLLDRCLQPLEEMERRNDKYRLGLLLSRLELLDEGLGVFLEKHRKDPRPTCR